MAIFDTLIQLVWSQTSVFLENVLNVFVKAFGATKTKKKWGRAFLFVLGVIKPSKTIKNNIGKGFRWFFDTVGKRVKLF